MADSFGKSNDYFDLDDPLRSQILAAAAKVIGEKGYYDTRIVDVVRAAGLSAGALYGRFESKEDLLKAAIVEATYSDSAATGYNRDLIAEMTVNAALNEAPLGDNEALRLEAFVTSRRDDEVASAVREAQELRRQSAQPIVDDALGGPASPEMNMQVDAALYILETLHLGFLLQRSAGIRPRDPDAWAEVVTEMVNSLLDDVIERANKLR